MNQVIAWAGFLGARLLVAGPLYQGARRRSTAYRDAAFAQLNAALRMSRDAQPSGAVQEPA